MNAEPAGPVLDALREVLDPWLGEPKRKQNNALVTLAYRFQSESGQPLRLKVEINTREHFAVHGFKEIPFAVNSRWYDGSCSILSYELNELLGTKLRALYQRKKGRDLFDLAIALGQKEADPEKIVAAFYTYMEHGEYKVTRKQFQENVAAKMKDKNFASDIGPLLASGYEWDLIAMSEKVNDALISRLPE